MSDLVVTWVLDCHGCNVRHVAERRLSLETWAESWFDIWGPGVPDGWLQQSPKDGETEWQFWHSSECYRDWLRRQGRYEDLRRFDETPWMG